MNNAVLVNRPPANWSALRIWASGQRDRLTPEESHRRGIDSLISLLDSEEDLRVRCPVASKLVGQSARLLADKIAATPW